MKIYIGCTDLVNVNTAVNLDSYKEKFYIEFIKKDASFVYDHVTVVLMLRTQHRTLPTFFSGNTIFFLFQP